MRILRGLVSAALLLVTAYGAGQAGHPAKRPKAKWPRDLQQQYIASAGILNAALVHIELHPATTVNQERVWGTGFVINEDGYYVTAAHVVRHPPNTNLELRIPALCVPNTVLCWEGDSVDVVDVDEEHDLALCRSRLIKAQFDLRRSGKSLGASWRVLAPLSVAQEGPSLGSIVGIGGFPLGTLVPVVEFGTVAASYANYPPLDAPFVDGMSLLRMQDLVQLAVTANPGNSGGPVVSTSSGALIGVVVQAVPAPLFPNAVPKQSSGLTLAVPSKYVIALLRKNNVSFDSKASHR